MFPTMKNQHVAERRRFRMGMPMLNMPLVASPLNLGL